MISLPFIKQKNTRSYRNEELEKRCTDLTERLADIRSCYDMAQDNDTIEALIYEENAVLCRLAALYKQARAEGVSLQPYERSQ